ncbi:carbon catabolite repressor protein 4 homolog 5-like [Tasmannia lanceolata]|uniref:carbon catabolite repressor protein 4 homolog 5-like n=1 Tax=Tasmannia lanceolata TaxID=3420 RepID=UPI004063EBC7
MRNKGYIGSFKRRTGEAMDGCAIFWKENLFCLLEGESIEFKGFGLRDNVAQLFVFEVELMMLKEVAMHLLLHFLLTAGKIPVVS